MKTTFSRALASLLMLLFALSPVWATCGGGGGGGTGGVSGGGGNNGGPTPVVYNVPWRIWEAKTAPAKGLVLYWFPASNDEVKKSPMKGSRILTLYSAQCVAMSVADPKEPELQKFVGDSKPPVAVLATADGSPINKVESNAGKLKIDQVEKAVDAEMKQRENALDAKLKEGKEKEKAGDNTGAIAALKAVTEEGCLFPKKSKEAAKELKKLGVAEVGSYPAVTPIFERRESARIEQVMRNGLVAEIREQYTVAEKYYSQAHKMDPADPTPLRYLGELYRHHIGDWEKARTTFESILNMPADSIARAVALHGLGKMTIHEGQFKKGLSLMEQSVAEFPLALAYRNLAVYWNSEGDLEKGNAYTQKALALDPKDQYNLVFAAVFMAASGHGDEALKIAQRNHAMLPASYNLAAIYAQTGHKEEALALLKRHFFRYERYQNVRAKEMMEARVDAVFDSLRQDSSFLALTSGADGRLQMPTGSMKGMQQK
ncbi:MAG TPA: tetratricopeptide repeat protein [Pyrinomonadaceae bacterium]|jgi:Putative Zn-dependent protease, contains TPR repeats|nr:tetratricopeptide repeat protein [Pyrinomonadaceae bacterium]